VTPERFNLVFGKGHTFDRVLLPETFKLIERWELFFPRRYPDGFWPDGTVKYSIAFGHSEGGDHEPKRIDEAMELSLDEGREILKLDVATNARYINARITTPLTDYMFGALVSLTYQFGQGRLDRYASEIWAILNSGDYIKAAKRLATLDFNSKLKPLDGLFLRRCTEIGFFMTRID
jgi:GH24 family phage-related lysozyme (muramidase)